MVGIDAPEVWGGTECGGPQASRAFEEEATRRHPREAGLRFDAGPGRPVRPAAAVRHPGSTWSAVATQVRRTAENAVLRFDASHDEAATVVSGLGAGDEECDTPWLVQAETAIVSAALNRVPRRICSPVPCRLFLQCAPFARRYETTLDPLHPSEARPQFGTCVYLSAADPCVVMGGRVDQAAVCYIVLHSGREDDQPARTTQ